MMEFSAEQRRKAVEQIVAKEGFGITDLYANAVNIQCQLNAAVELLRQAKRALEVAGYSPSSITDFLSAFTEGGKDV